MASKLLEGAVQAGRRLDRKPVMDVASQITSSILKKGGSEYDAADGAATVVNARVGCSAS